MKIDFKNKKIILLAALLLLVIFLLSAKVYLLINKDKTGEPEQSSRERCLAEDEFADYPLDERYDERVKIPKTPIVVYVRDKVTKNKKFSFQIEDVPQDRAYSLELHTCGAYVIKMFNYDPKKSKQNPGFKAELWKYRYDGTSHKLLLLAEKDKDGIYKGYHSYNFNIDPEEKYLVLEQSYPEHEDYALVIKNLNTLEDLFVLKLKDILATNQNIIPGSFSFGYWIEDGKRLCDVLYQGAFDTAYYCIKTDNWETEIFPSPPDLLAGVERTITFKSWHLAYVDIPTFTGFQEVYEQIIEEAKRTGKQKNVFVYNLVTREKIKVASADPEWGFNIKWISDTELEYELPSGERKIYNIDNQ